MGLVTTALLLASLGVPAAGSCPTTRVVDHLVDVIGPLTGADPLWHTTPLVWSPEPIKTPWVVSKDSVGDLEVTGRRLDGPGRLRFQRGAHAKPTDRLFIADPQDDEMLPGGAGGGGSPDVSPEQARAARAAVARYSFRGSYLLASGPGCWEIRARLGDRRVRTVVLLAEHPPGHPR